MRLDVVFGSCCSPGMTWTLTSSMTWIFFPFCKRQDDGCLFFFCSLFMLLISRTFSSQCHRYEESGCNSSRKPINSVKLKLSYRDFWGALASLCQPPPPCVRNAGRVTTILSHPYLSPSFCVLVHWRSSVKHIVSSALLVYRFFQLNVCLWLIRPVGGSWRGAGGVNNLLVYLRFYFLTKLGLFFFWRNPRAWQTVLNVDMLIT